jgi:hypothetical protein
VILPGHKYACFAFRHFPVAEDMPDMHQIAPGMWVLRRPPVDLEQHWRDWLGSLGIDKVRNADFVLLAVKPSATLEVLDGENTGLVDRVDHWYHGLLLHGVPLLEQKGVCLTGANRRDRPDVRNFADLDPMYPSHEIPPVRVGLADLARAWQLGETLERLHVGNDWERFHRGFSTLLRGFRDTDGGMRLRHFVQALEGLVKPPVGRSRAVFVHRCLNTSHPIE